MTFVYDDALQQCMIVKGAVCYCSQTFLSRSGYKTILDSALPWRYRCLDAEQLLHGKQQWALSSQCRAFLFPVCSKGRIQQQPVLSEPSSCTHLFQGAQRAVISLQQQQVQLLDAEPLCSIETWGSVPHWVI